VVSGSSSHLRLILVSARAFPPHKVVSTDASEYAFGRLDDCCTVQAFTTISSRHDETQVLLPISSTRRQAPTSIQISLAQGGQRLLGRKVLTNCIGLPQAGHCISGEDNSVVGNGGYGWVGAAAPGRNCCTLLSAFRWLGL
jgi:hypothetical protein